MHPSFTAFHLRPAWRWRLGIVVALLLAACGGGDGGGGGQKPPGGVVVGEPLAAACPGDTSQATSRIYVAPNGVDGDACGTSSTNACATIAQGLARCAGTGCAVLVRYGLYPTSASLNLRDGVGVYGGCRFNGEPPAGYRTVIQASPAPGAAAVVANGIASPTVFADIVVVGKDETLPATASIAMAVTSSQGLTLQRTTLAAGTGGDAGPAASAQAAGGSGQGGGTGNASVGGAAGASGASCPANPPADGITGAGGQGGQSPFNAPDVCHVMEGSPGAGGRSANVAGGGAGGRGAAGLYCAGLLGPGDGGNGGNGSPGACGQPTQASLQTAGSLGRGDAGLAWTPSSGQNGQDGFVGSGGGGGGDGGICVVNPGGNYIDAPGLPGGGGGGGGCGGTAGQGGQQGGASLALVVADSTLNLEPVTNAIVPGPGGRGGHAGSASAGGPGGSGGGAQSQGKNLFSFFYCGGSGGYGGTGGYGGAGSAGAAGNGGPSIGLAFSGTTPVPAGLDGIYAPWPGAPGNGATGGAAAPAQGACKGPDGPAGQPGAGALAFALDAAAQPPQSLLTAGATLLPGQSRTSPDGKVELLMQYDGNLCLYAGGNAPWCILSEGESPIGVTMQTDGNLCVSYAGGDTAKRCLSDTGPSGPAWSYLQVSNSGHLVFTDGVNVLRQVP